MTLFVETVKFMLGNGASAEIRPLTYRQREHARKVARDTALELAGSIDPKLLGSFRDNREAVEAAAPTAQLTGDLDTMTVLVYGLVSVTKRDGEKRVNEPPSAYIDGDGEVIPPDDAAPRLLDELAATASDRLAKEIFRLTTLEDTENLSNG